MSYYPKSFSLIERWTKFDKRFSANRLVITLVLCLLTLFSEVDAQKKWYFRAKTPFFNVNSISAVDSFHIFVTAQDGLYKTTDGGGRWTRIVSETGLETVSFRSRTDGILQKYGLLRATNDGGITWSVYSNRYFTAPIKFLTSLSGISAIVNNASQVFFCNTVNGGISWEEYRVVSLVGALKYVAQMDSIVWGAGFFLWGPGPAPMLAESLQYSTNYGVTWTERSYSYSHPTYTDLVLMRPNFIIIAHNNNLLKISSNGGTTFTDYPKPSGVYSLKSFGDAPGSDNAILYAGADSGKIGYSGNFGVTFELQKMNTDSPVKCLEIMKNGEGYAFATDGSFFSTIQLKIAPVSVDETLSDLLSEFSLAQNYPNPFNPSTTIQFGLPKSMYVKGVIYDIIGREIETIIDGELFAGDHSVVWDATDVLSGIYFFRIQAGDHTSVIKMVLLK